MNSSQSPTATPIRNKSELRYAELPLSQLHEFEHYERQREFGDSWYDQRLIESLEENGVIIPIHVAWMNADTYCIVDGHRRYNAARALNWPDIPCYVHQKLNRRDAIALRYALQGTAKPWMQMEWTEWLRNIKRASDHDPAIPYQRIYRMYLESQVH